MLNTYTLHYFFVTAQHLSFSKAAKHLYITQPALSKQIQQLEDQLQVKLFDRSRRSVRLTEAGQVLMEQCRDVFDSLSRLEKAIGLFRTEVRGSLHIAAVPSVGNYLLPDFLKRFSSQFPQIKLHTVVKPVDEIAEMVRIEDVDFGLMNLETVPHELKAVDMGRRNMVFICSNHCERPCKHQKKDEMRIEDLEDCHLMTFDRNTTSRRLLDGLLREKNIKLDIFFESENVNILKQMVLRGMGGALVPEYSIGSDNEGERLRVKPLKENRLSFPLRLYYNKNLFLSRAHQEFLTLFTQTYGTGKKKSDK